MSRSGGEDSRSTLSAVRLLVVDDTVAVREVLAAILEFHGADVSTAATADEALRRVQEWRPDALLSDIEMPGRDGYWLIAQVRGLPAECGGQTPAIALTGLNGPADRARALKAGFQFHLAKPVELENLVGAVAALALRP
jgi:CheY-like chemotaxis protein